MELNTVLIYFLGIKKGISFDPILPYHLFRSKTNRLNLPIKVGKANLNVERFSNFLDYFFVIGQPGEDVQADEMPPFYFTITQCTFILKF